MHIRFKTRIVMDDIQKNTKTSAGFTLVEVVVAMVVMSIMLLGTLAVFTYAVQYNRGNNMRSQALTVLQKRAELFRSAKFTSLGVTDLELAGGEYTTEDSISYPEQMKFTIKITVDDDPFTDGLQVLAKPTLKEIKLEVRPKNAQSAWESAVVSRAVIQRVRGN